MRIFSSTRTARKAPTQCAVTLSPNMRTACATLSGSLCGTLAMFMLSTAPAVAADTTQASDAAAEHVARKPVTVNRPEGTYTVVQLQLQAAEGSKITYPRATLAFRDSVGASGMIPLDLPTGYYDASQLSFDGNTITGTLRDQFPGVPAGDLVSVTFDLTVTDGQVTGSFAVVAGPKTTKHKVHADVQDHQGTVTGVTQSAEYLKETQAYKPEAHWSMWSGPA